MTTEERDRMLELLNSNYKKLVDKDFNVYFYIMDTKGNPSGALEYVYDIAKTVSDLGYHVIMLYSGNEFTGVEDWLGKDFAALEHKQIDSDNVEISPCDFLFIPDLFTNVMIQTKKFSCKRVAIVQNYSYLYDYLPAGVGFDNLGITDVITTTEEQAKVIAGVFNQVRVHVVEPFVHSVFRKSQEPQKLIVNIVSKRSEDASRIIKPFYLKYPMYKWVTFRDLRGLPQDEFARSLRENALTIWIDNDTKFGYAGLEAMKSGSILISKVPEHLSDWMITTENDENGLAKCCAWFDDINSVPDMVASAVRTWTLDLVPDEIYSEQDKMSTKYTEEHFKDSVSKVICLKMFDKREKEFMDVINQLNNNAIKQ